MERDYTQNWLLFGLSKTSLKMALKGGTGIKKIVHPYSDECNAGILVYPLEEIFAEKVRSLFQRTRPRDLYDIWRLKDIIGWRAEVIFGKGVQMEFEEFERRKPYYERAWEMSLAHQINPLPEFDKVWNEVLKFLEDWRRVLSHKDQKTSNGSESHERGWSYHSFYQIININKSLLSIC